MADEQERAESLDDDKLARDYPPDEPVASDDYGTTGAEQEWDEPLEERVAREEPDKPATSDEDVAVPLVEPEGAGREAEALGEDIGSREQSTELEGFGEEAEGPEEQPAEEQAVTERRQ